MKYLILTIFCFSIPFYSAAQTIEAHGNLLYTPKGKTLHIKISSGNIPKKGQAVSIDKSFQLGRMSGTHSLAEGEVIGGTNKDLEVKVSKYTSTKVVDGETVPMCKAGDEMIITWTGSEEELATANFDENLVEAKSAFLHAEYKNAIEMCEKLLKVDDHCIDCHYVIGRAQLSLGENKKAIQAFTKAIDLNHESVKGVLSAYVYRRDAYTKNKQYDEAIGDCDKLLTLDLKTSDILFLLKRKLFLYSLEERSVKYDHNIARTHECECVNKLIALEGKTEENKGLYNRNCIKEHPADKKSAFSEFEVISQSEDKNTIKVRSVDAKDLSCEDNITHNPSPKKETCGNLFFCETGERSSRFLITAIEGNVITLKILYWGYNAKEEYTIHNYKKGDILVGEW